MQELSKVVRRSVTRLLRRKRAPLSCDVEDLTQHVLAHLFAHDGHVLTTWDESYGLPYAGYIGMVAERAAISALRRRDHNPRGEHCADPQDLDRCSFGARGAEDQLVAADYSRTLVRRLEQELSPLGQRVLRALYAEGMSIEDTCRALSMSADSLYAWRSRIKQRALQLARELGEDPAMAAT